MTTLDDWIDENMREMRVMFRDMFSYWTVSDQDEMIKRAEKLRFKLDSFIDYLKKKRKMG